MCCLVLRSNFALLLTIQFALLISSLINIISLLLTTFDWTKVEMRRVVCVEFFIFGGSLLGRIQGDRKPVSLFLNLFSFADVRLDYYHDCLLASMATCNSFLSAFDKDSHDLFVICTSGLQCAGISPMYRSCISYYYYCDFKVIFDNHHTLDN